MKNSSGLYSGRTEYRRSDYYFERTCPGGFRPEREQSSGLAWWLAGAGVAVLILCAVMA